jgi:hypothetical protein
MRSRTVGGITTADLECVASDAAKRRRESGSGDLPAGAPVQIRSDKLAPQLTESFFPLEGEGRRSQHGPLPLDEPSRRASVAGHERGRDAKTSSALAATCGRRCVRL